MASCVTPLPEVPKELQVANREKLISSLRHRLSLSSRPLQGFVFLQGVATGKSILFAPRLSADYALWLGEIKPLSYFKGIEKFGTDLDTLHPILTECRVLKSDLELALIQFANDISSEAHVEFLCNHIP